MNAAIIKNRIKAIRRQLNKNNLNCLIVTKPANVTYTTSFGGDDSWAVITKRDVYLLTDSRYTEQAQAQCCNCKIIERKNSIEKATVDIINKQKSVNITAIEKTASIASFRLIRKNLKSKVRPAGEIIESIRCVKDTTEINAIKAAAKIAANALKQICPKIKPGITENQLAGLLDYRIRQLGGKNSFETIVAFGPNGSRPHHQPTNRKLKKNDYVLIDFGVRYKGYCCDLTRCFVVGKPTTFYKKVYDAVQEAQTAAIKMIKDGVEMKKIDAAAREVLKKHNLPVYGHGTGHGLGLEVHEVPLINAKSRGKLQAGMVLTIEPALYIPGKLGIRIEDDVLVTETGCRILAPDCPHYP